ncbi:hypothetical protein CFC21_026192 [Triticum aestivum]|uniref:Uncharacterized protein n=2 Tax=Triticum aestivum TaxID=4565 RepID=A0A9R1EKM5_WHEAT|nr:hypothetical protein CFC21_026192 [Triticum aestivum]
MASGGGKVTALSWAAVMSVGAGAGTVEALKGRHAGLCRWKYHALPCVQQHTGTAVAGNGKTMAAPAAGGAAARRRKARKEEEEEELRTVMYLSNWGPNN